MDTQKPLNDKIDSSNESIAKLKSDVEKGIELLSSITSDTQHKHPLLVAKREREHRLGNESNQTCGFRVHCITQFHNSVITTMTQIGELENKIDSWAKAAIKSLEAFKPGAKYLERFNSLKCNIEKRPTLPEEPKARAELFADMQIRLKTQLENQIYFLLRRIAYYEEFEGTLLDLLIDDYTRRFLNVLISEKLLSWADIYPDYYDPLFMLLPEKDVGRIEIRFDDNIENIIRIIRLQMTKASRVNYCFNIARFIIDGTEPSKNICDKISMVKDDFERDIKPLFGRKSWPEKFIGRWDEKLHGIEQTFDLMTAINRLPADLRDSEPLRKGKRSVIRMITIETDSYIKYIYNQLKKENPGKKGPELWDLTAAKFEVDKGLKISPRKVKAAIYKENRKRSNSSK